MFCGRSQTSKESKKWLSFPNELKIIKKKEKKKNPIHSANAVNKIQLIFLDYEAAYINLAEKICSNEF